MYGTLLRHPLRSLLVAAGAIGLVRFARAARGVPTALGASRRRLFPTVSGSPHYRDGQFANRLPGTAIGAGGAPRLVIALLQHRDHGKPAGEIPVSRPEFPATAADLAVTWLGHASALLEIDGHRLLFDPLFSARASPSTRVGPHRMHPTPLDPAELPEVGAIVISHDHYDHLDLPTIRTLVATQSAPFLVPIGIGTHLRGWGIPEERIVELDWDESTTVGPLTLTCTEARHFSGRGVTRNLTQWGSWSIAGPAHRVYFGGDTGYTPAFAGIGARRGRFDLTLLPIGAYADQWPDIHMDPEQAWRAHGDLGGDIMVPIHWGTFDLALHGWAEPVERLLTAAGEDPRVVIPRPGQRLDLAQLPERTNWWRPLAR